MKNTNMPSAPWYIIDAKSRKWTELQVLETLTQGIEIALSNQKTGSASFAECFPVSADAAFVRRCRWTKRLETDEYRKELKATAEPAWRAAQPSLPEESAGHHCL